MSTPFPNVGTRFALVTVVLMLALLVGGANAGVSGADPDESGNTGVDNSSETAPAENPGTVPEPAPTAITAPAPRTLSEQLRDFLRRPLSIFGNGRTPGEGTATTPGTSSGTSKSHSKPERRPHADFGKKPDPDPGPAAGAQEGPERSPGSGESRRATPAEEPQAETGAPSPPRPRLTVDPTTPPAVERTLQTFSALIDDACAPHDPAPPAPPEEPAQSQVPSQRQAPSFKIASEDPVDVDGGAVVDAFSTGHGDHLPVLQAPVVPLAPAPRGFPEPIHGSIGGPGTAAAAPNAPATGPAATVPGGPPAELGPPGTSPPAVRPALREGSQRGPAVTRAGELLVIALPGLLGLVAVTSLGGVLGYRQANSARYVRDGALRYLR